MVDRTNGMGAGGGLNLGGRSRRGRRQSRSGGADRGVPQVGAHDDSHDQSCGQRRQQHRPAPARLVCRLGLTNTLHDIGPEGGWGLGYRQGTEQLSLPLVRGGPLPAVRT